jgi:hypothetical protein
MEVRDQFHAPDALPQGNKVLERLTALQSKSVSCEEKPLVHVENRTAIHHIPEPSTIRFTD